MTPAAQDRLVHDLAEGLLTDLPKRSTELLGKEVKHTAEAKAMAIILGAIANGDKYARLWEDYNSAATPEARLVRDADKLEMLHQALVYERAGGQCEHPGCTARHFLEVHHVIHWEDGGRTDLANLRLYCSGHHRHEHERPGG